LWRVIALLLVLGVGAGPALLDPCLAGCHEPADRTAVPACHESAAATGTAISGTADCGHDHTGIEADTALESRLTSARQAVQAMVVPEATPSAKPLLSGSGVRTRRPSALRPHVPRRPQLRV
jgi:hypothetical protein